MSNQRKPSRKPAHRAWWMSPFVWAGAVIVIAMAAAVLINPDDGATVTDTATFQTAPATVTGSRLPPLSIPDPALGQQAPAVTAETFTDGQISLTADGTARLYGFFAHWCPHCREELPAVAEWLRTDPLPDNVEVIAVSTDVRADAPNHPPSAWFATEEWPTTVLVDSSDGVIAASFGLTGFPYWVAVDAEGQVVQRLAGQLGVDQLESLVALVDPAG